MSSNSVKVTSREMPWWLFLITAVAWTIIAWVVLRFNLRSVAAVATLAGIIILMAAAAEAFYAFTSPGWKWLHGILAALFLVTGVMALIHPGSTFVWLAAFIGWYLLFKGIADIFLALATKRENDAWWLTLIVGILQVSIGFWAAGRFGRSAYILIVYVGVIALARAVSDIVMAFKLREGQHGRRPVAEAVPAGQHATTSAMPTAPGRPAPAR